jgi:oligopeptide/dipeptide ABC transporter ATP-binding protein
MEKITLKVENLTTVFNTEKGVVKVVDDLSFHIKAGEVLGLVGESGSGKSVTSLSIMQLIPNPPGKIAGGSAFFNGENLFTKTKEQMRQIRGSGISMIFQEPMTSLNPVYTVGNQLIEAVRVHSKVSEKEALARAIDLLNSVGISLPEKRMKSYPHQFSGGMRQRIMIAMALACEPQLLIADEPTTALDVTIQAQILDLIRKINLSFNTAVLLVTHDMGVVAQLCDRVCVIYAGRLMEEADTVRLFERPVHPYTEALLNSIPSLEKAVERLTTIEGILPEPFNLPSGCRFADRCKHALEKCHREQPLLEEFGLNHFAYCWNPIKYEKQGRGDE